MIFCKLCGSTDVNRYLLLNIIKWLFQGMAVQKISHTLWKHHTLYSCQLYSWVSSLACPLTRLSEVNGTCQWTLFDLMTLTFWPMPLTYGLDLDILPLDLNAKIQVCMSVCLAGTDRQTDRHIHTDTRCQNYYTRHVRDVGCKYVAWGSLPVWLSIFE